MPERTLAEYNKTFEMLNEVDPDMARRFKSLVYPERAITELEKELHELREVHTALFNRWRNSREELHALRMSLVTLGFERRALLPGGIDAEFAKWYAAFECDMSEPYALPFPTSNRDKFKVGYIAGRCADQYYKENPLAEGVHEICRRLYGQRNKKWWQFWRG